MQTISTPRTTERTGNAPLESPLRPAAGDVPISRHPHPREPLFSVPFKSRMSDADVARLKTELDLVTYLTPKPGVSGASPGVVPLDFWSALYLQRGAAEGEWALDARTWGDPPREAIHAWHVRAALAARKLDSRVEIPPRQATATPAPPSLPLGRAANKRFARLGRLVLGLE
jgi:hypothetical protein